MREERRAGGLAATLLLCLCFGSIHAYGVITVPLERELSVGRALASLGYALAIVMLTAGVFATAALGRRFSRRGLAVTACAASACGVLLAAIVPGLAAVLLGYGLVFGFANGVAYSLALTIAAAALPQRAAFAMGLATAAYGTGAMLFAIIAAAALGYGGPRTVFTLLAAILAVCTLLMLVLALPAEDGPNRMAEERGATAFTGLAMLWAGYLCLAFSGLMIIAHAPAIAAEAAGTPAGTVAPLVAGGSVLGGVLGGALVARWPGWPSLAAPALLQLLALVILLLPAAALLTTAALAATGLCYGIIIAVVPGLVRLAAGAEGFAMAYGRVFTAWGLAGFAGPLAGGALHDASGSYAGALAAAALLTAAGTAVPLFGIVRPARSARPAKSV